MAVADTEAPSASLSSAPPLPPRTVFFDGVCNFCDWSVQFLLAHDADERLHFAPLQGETASALIRRLPDFPDHLDTIVYVELIDGRPVVTSQSRAIFRVLEQLDASARRWRVLRLLPEWLANFAYRAFGRWRYRLFGKRDTCRVPSPAVRARFLP